MNDINKSDVNTCDGVPEGVPEVIFTQEEMIRAIRLAIFDIQTKEGIAKPKRTIFGQIKCPICNSDLFYKIGGSSGRIWGQCSKKNCLNWI